MKDDNAKILTFEFLTREDGQSLAELVIALAVGGIIIASAAVAITLVLRNDIEVRDVQIATALAQQSLDNVQATSEANWRALYNLPKETSAQYVIIPGATPAVSTTVYAGWEGVLADDVSAGLVGYWKFDEGSGAATYDFSGNGNNGTLNGGPTWMSSSSCRMGTCLSFNGTSGQQVSVPQLLSGNNAFTAAAWVNPADITSNWKTVFAEGCSGFDLAINAATIEFGRNCGQGNGFYAGPTVNAGEWVHLAIVFDGTNINLYKNGVVMVGGPAVYSHANLFIGSYNGTNEMFKGKLDDIRIYNRVLSGEEISRLYKSAVFNRYWSVENVNRDSCGAGNVTANATTSCGNGPGSGGVAEDPSTQKITAHIEWMGGRSLVKTQYVSRYLNRAFDQTDWSGGSGQVGPITNPNSQFYSATDVNIGTQGSIKIQGL